MDFVNECPWTRSSGMNDRGEAVTMGRIFLPEIKNSYKYRKQVWKPAMSSILYSRYIPPKNSKVAFQYADSNLTTSETTPSLIQNAPLETTLFRQHSPELPSLQPTPSSPSKPLKRKHKDDVHLLDDQQPRSKRSKGHKSLLLKRNKSAKKSEILVSLLFLCLCSQSFLRTFINSL